MTYPKYASRAVCLLALLPMTLAAQRALENTVPLKNWASPLYWQPSQAESQARGVLLPQLPPAPMPEPAFLTFVAITPCRLVDTRGAAAGFTGGVSPFNGLSLGPNTTTTFLVQSSTEATGPDANTGPAACGVIPSIAQAYSLNVTVIPHSGAVDNFLTLWAYGANQPIVSTVNDPQGVIVANAAIVAAGEKGAVSLYNSGPATVDVVIDMNGYFASPTNLNNNTALGAGTLANNDGGSGNTATGADALQANTTGSNNTASGYEALNANTAGVNNTAFGYEALLNNTANYNTALGYQALMTNTTGSYNTATGQNAMAYGTGSNNTATGYGALLLTTGVSNTASGLYAMEYNTSGNYNTASGQNAMQANTSGANNTAVGYEALNVNVNGINNIAIGYTAGNAGPTSSNNTIYIGSPGSSLDLTGTIRIGDPTIATSAFLGGVFGAPVSGGTEVFVNANGQLGTLVSSSRFKEQVTDMGDSSSKLLQLRPVNYFYKPEYDDGSHLLQYGLIAEDVAKVYPEMVAYGKDGQVLTVKYQLLAPMLLNELQKQAAQNRQQAEDIRSLEDRLATLEAFLPIAPEPVR